MKKIVLLSAFMLILASCSAPAVEETPAATTDTTCVAVDSTCAVVCDSVKADTTKK